ncbi:zinc knuckle CX2CX4HX4C [Artemisia annua]|uniref:Zinc knuckle CX2CX4HX4C n=1 Tax=Artemisia annua TaxID=35608 RepID=A0A2U1KRH5_ARTAN|nr:zinc knuckle CX2CX4HX4C [Artemisia annua]
MVSSIGVPIIMDRMTTSICEKPYGRASFARLLIEIDSNKALVDNVELWYESLGKILRLRVEYTWVPPRCEECKVYGRYTNECVKKVNMVSKVNKDGENVKVADTEKAKNVGMVNNGDGDEGWQTAVNRRNNRGAGGKGQLGVTINRGNHNVGTRDANKKYESVNKGSVGNIDESVVVNEQDMSANKGKNKLNEGGFTTTGKSTSGKADPKKNTTNNKYGNTNDMVADKGNKTDKGTKSSNNVSGKDGLGAKSVATSNRFDLLRDDNANAEPDLWKEVKELVAAACNTGVQIGDDVLKGWNEDMIKYYMVKWKNRAKNSGYVKQQLETKMKILVSQIVQINRNLHKNSKLNAEKKLMNFVLTTQDASDVSLSKFQPTTAIQQLHSWIFSTPTSSLFLFLLSFIDKDYISTLPA